MMFDVRDKRRQVKANQAHVMRERHPAETAVSFGELDALRDRGDVREQIAVGEGDAFGLAGRTRRILDEGYVVGHGGMSTPRLGYVFDAIDKNGF